MLNFKTARQYVAEQSEDDTFVAELEQARLETELAVALAMLREQRGQTPLRPNLNQDQKCLNGTIDQ